MQQQAGGGLVGPWVEAEVCSEPLRGLSLTNLLRETYSSITLLGGASASHGASASRGRTCSVLGRGAAEGKWGYGSSLVTLLAAWESGTQGCGFAVAVREQGGQSGAWP